MALSRFAVLFDVDGVLLRNKKVLKSVENNCVKFIQKVSQGPLEYNVAYHRNYMYNFYHGHTLRGLYKQYGTQYDHRITDLFINEVYDKTVYSELNEHLESKEFKEESKPIMEICELCKENDVPVFIFSNAPYDWCKRIAISLEEGTTFFEHIYSCEHYSMYPHSLKPDELVYKNVEFDIKMNNYNVNELVFIDDSLMNLQPVNYNRLWKPVLLDPSNRTNGSIQSINNILEFKKMIETKISSLPIEEPVYNLYLVHKHEKNVATVKMILRSCIPHLCHLRLEQIIMEANKNGKAILMSCTQKEAITYKVLMLENGFDVEFEEKII